MAPIRLLGSVSYSEQDHGWALDIGILLAQWIYISTLSQHSVWEADKETIEEIRSRAFAMNEMLTARRLAIQLPISAQGTELLSYYESVFHNINLLIPRHYGIFAAVGAAAAVLNMGKKLVGIMAEEHKVLVRGILRPLAEDRIRSLPGIDRERFANRFQPDEVMRILGTLPGTDDDVKEKVRSLLHELSRPMIILFVFADPPDQSRLSLGEEQRLVHDSLARGMERDSFEVEIMPNARPEDLGPQLRRLRPTFVHFSGHGSADGLVFSSGAGSARQVQPSALFRLLRLAAHDRLKGVVMNACYSAEQLQTLAHEASLPCPTVVMEAEVSDAAAMSFSQQFYSYLGDGETFKDAFEWAGASSDLTGDNGRMIAQLVE
ncbi:hypothetical protein NU195Hw_g8798t1 [Hortaea werneckii]